MSTLWMGDLDPYMDERFIRAAFAAAAHAALNVKPIINKATGITAGYCFVEFSSQENAENALLKLNGSIVPASNPPKRFKLNWATHGKDVIQQQTPEYSIFVGDLTPDVSDQMLLDFFRSRYPTCKSAKVVIDTVGASRGYGFVRFINESEQQRSMTEMQGARGCGSKAIRVSAATPKKVATSTSTATAAPLSTAAANQQYLQQYQQYLAAWQATYQQQVAQFYSGYNQFATPAVTYQQQYNEAQPVPTATPTTCDYSETHEVDNSQITEDPNAPLDVVTENQELINTEERLYCELEESRWHPLETWTEGTVVA